MALCGRYQITNVHLYLSSSILFNDVINVHCLTCVLGCHYTSSVINHLQKGSYIKLDMSPEWAECGRPGTWINYNTNCQVNEHCNCSYPPLPIGLKATRFVFLVVWCQNDRWWCPPASNACTHMLMGPQTYDMWPLYISWHLTGFELRALPKYWEMPISCVEGSGRGVACTGSINATATDAVF